MPRIDFYLNSMERFSATGIVLTSGAKVVLRFTTGDRVSAQTTAHEDLVSLVEEIAPSSAVTGLRAGARKSFLYEMKGKTFVVTVEPGPREWKVELEPRREGNDANPAPADRERRGGRDASSIRGAPAPASAAATSAWSQQQTPEHEPPSPPPPTGPRVAQSRAPASAAPPPRASAPSGTAAEIDKLLKQMFDLGASDLHLCCGSPPYVRHHGEMRVLQGYAPFTDDSLLPQLLEIAPARNREEYERRNDTDFAHAIPGVSRFRANFFRDRRGCGAVFRTIPFKVRNATELGIPPAVLDLCSLTKGLVLVTGPTGSGKSTTLAALIDHVNTTRSDHIITVEDPIEFVHDNKKCLVNQREVHTHTESFKDALRAALREDPDIVLVGEMRDLETISIAVETAETGHLVFGTLHTTTAPSTVDRIIDQFPTDRQEQIRQMLSESLRGVIAQTLCRKKGGGVVAAYEILIASGAVANLIRERKTFQLPSLMQTSRGAGMVTLNDSLLDLVRKGVIEPREAYLKAVQKNDLKTALAREGVSVEEEAN